MFCCVHNNYVERCESDKRQNSADTGRPTVGEFLRYPEDQRVSISVPQEGQTNADHGPADPRWRCFSCAGQP